MEVAAVFARAQEESSALVKQRTQRRKEAAEWCDLDDYYGEEVEEEGGEGRRMFDPDVDFLHERFRVAGPPPRCERPAEGERGGEFRFQHTETTYGLTEEDGHPEIRLWGVTRAGESVLVRVRDFFPYFYVGGVESAAEMERIVPKLEAHLARTTMCRKGEKRIQRYVVKVDALEGRSICGYLAEVGPIYRIAVARPSVVANARDCFDFCNRNVVEHSYPTYEANVPFELRFMVDAHLFGCQWIAVGEGEGEERGVSFTGEFPPISTAQHELITTAPRVRAIPLEECGDIAPLRFLSYDIEVLRKEAGFPTADKNPVVTICCALNVVGAGIVDRVVLALRPSPEKTYHAIEGAAVYAYDDEREMLMAFSQYVCRCDPEGLTGWNTSNFDMPYLAARAREHDIFAPFMEFSRLPGRGAWLRERVFQSKAYGAKKTTELLCEGRFDFDAFVFMLRGQMKKLRLYTLNNVAATLLGETKLDVAYSQIPLLYESDDDEDRTRLAHYCLKDAELPLQILDKMMAVVNGVEQARVTGVTFKWLLTKGQGIKTFSNLLRHKGRNEYVPTLSPRASTGETAGGHVEEPRRGWYPMPLITLDFASLYPAIMIAYNICYSTLAPRAWARERLTEGDYWSPLPAVDGGAETDFVFVRKHVREGILPGFLVDLLATRARVRALITKDTDPFLCSVYNGRQLALKVVCNSVYGFLKAFILRDKRLMSAVTAYGRNMIYKVKEVVQRDFAQVRLVDVEECKKRGIDPESDAERPCCALSAFIVYGDSVTPDTPVLIRLGGLLHYVNIENVPVRGAWEEYHGDKEAAVPVDGCEIWSDAGFTPLKRVIRHRTTKDIFRVLTHTGCVSVTSDHSLLTPEGAKIGPREVAVGSKLLHAPLPGVEESEIDFTLVWNACPYAMGLFYGDGSCGNYGEGQKNKSSWAINKSNLVVLRKAKRELNAFYKNDNISFKILDTMESSHVYKLVMVGPSIKPTILEWRALFYTPRKQKQVPAVILNAPIRIVEAFMTGYYDADGEKGGYHRFDNKGAVGAAALLFLSERLGYHTSINNRADKKEIYRITCTKKAQRKCPTSIKRIENLGPTNEYVYDLETENHHFAAGVGKMVVHNTDSVMVCFGKHGAGAREKPSNTLLSMWKKELPPPSTELVPQHVTLTEMIRLGREMAERCTAEFVAPNSLTFETVKLRAGYLNKKRYFALEIEKFIPGERIADAIKRATISVKGLEGKRMDNAPINSATQNECIRILLKENDVPKIERYIESRIHDLLLGRVDMAELVITRGLAKTDEQYAKGGTKQLHVELKKRMQRRAHFTGEAVPETGDRVPYVIRASSTSEKASELSEHPLYALRENVPINVDYYINKQLWPAVARIMTCVYEAHRCPEIASTMSERVRQSLKVYRRFFAPEKLLVKKRARVGLYGIGGHATTESRCVGCGVGGAGACCSTCDAQVIRARLEEAHAEQQERADAAWDICRKCQGGSFNKITCSNLTCKNFFHREKMLMDLEDLGAKLKSIL